MYPRDVVIFDGRFVTGDATVHWDATNLTTGFHFQSEPEGQFVVNGASYANATERSSNKRSNGDSPGAFRPTLNQPTGMQVGRAEPCVPVEIGGRVAGGVDGHAAHRVVPVWVSEMEDASNGAGDSPEVSRS